MGELAYAVLRRQLAVVRDKEPGTRLGEDPEELHDMRVATRRMRAALALFAGVLPVRAQVFREELGWLARMLGAVRDLDVQLEGLADMADSHGRLERGHPARGPRAADRADRAARARARGGAARPCSARSTRCAGTACPRASPPWSSRARPGGRWPPAQPAAWACPSWSWRATRPW